MVATVPSTVLTNAANIEVRLRDASGNAANVYTDSSGTALRPGSVTATAAGDISPTTNPLYMDPATYTIDFTDTTGAVRTQSLVVTGTARPSPDAPNSQETGQATLAGPTVFAAGAVGLNGNTPVGKAAAITAPSTTGVVTPANAVYTVADQTALANAVLALATAVNAVRAALTNIGITS